MSYLVPWDVMVKPLSGSLAVFTDQFHSGTTTIYALNEQGEQGQVYYASVESWRGNDGQLYYVAYFPALPPGNYLVREPGYTMIGEKKVTVFSGAQADVAYYN